MSTICPNINLQEWKDLVNEVGEFEAYRDFLETDGLIRTPEEVKLKINVREKPEINLGESGFTNAGVRPAQTVLENTAKILAAKFGPEYGYIVKPVEGVTWKGKVEPASEYNGNKPTIVINSNLATLDTPLHEFGHIFLEMIKANNLSLYGNLINREFEKLSTDPRFAPIWDRILKHHNIDQTKPIDDSIKASNYTFTSGLSDEQLKKQVEGLRLSAFEVALREEFLVEMLGLYAAENVDPQTGAFKMLKELWNTIVKMLKDILNGRQLSTLTEQPTGVVEGTIDVLDIKPTTSIEGLSILLANDVQIKVGGEQDLVQLKENIKKAKEKLDEDRAKYEKLKTLTQDDVATINLPLSRQGRGRAGYAQAMAIAILLTKEQARNFKNVQNKFKGIAEYLDYKNVIYNNNNTAKTFYADFKDILHDVNIVKPSDFSTLTLQEQNKFVQDMINQITGDPDYEQFNYIVNQMSTDSRGNEVWGRTLKALLEAELNMHWADSDTWLQKYRELRQGFSYYDDAGRVVPFQQKTLHENSVLSDGLMGINLDVRDFLAGGSLGINVLGKTPISSRLTPEERAATAQRLQDDFDMFLNTISSDLDWKEQAYKDLSKAGGKKSRQVYTVLSFTDPETGNVITEQYSISGSIDSNSADIFGSYAMNVNFSSPSWGFSDPVWISKNKPIKKNDLVVVGNDLSKIKALDLTTPHDINRFKDSIDYDITYARVLEIKNPGTANEVLVLDFGDGITLLGDQQTSGRIFQSHAMYNKLVDAVRANAQELSDKNPNASPDFIRKKARAIIEAPKNTVLRVTPQNRQSTVMPVVFDAINEMIFNANVGLITFSPAATQFPLKENEDPGTKRRKLYRIYGERSFGQHFYINAQVTQTTQNRDSVPIPFEFRSAFSFDKTFYQDTGTSKEVPFNEHPENALINEPQNTPTGLALELNTVESSIDIENTEKVRAIEFANKLSSQLGIEYQIITPAQAAEITKNADNPWNGQSAFFIGGVVYFVGGILSTSQVLHEFAHPLVRAIANENPALIKNLYNQIENTEAGVEIINKVLQEYPNLDSESELFREEVIVRALTLAGEIQFEDITRDSRFSQVINNILYAIKQLLRRMFGKSSTVSKLKPTTTINELAQMLENGKQFSLDTNQISQEDVVAYLNDQEQYMKDLENIDNKEMQGVVNNFYDILAKHIDMLLKQERYEELAEILLDESRQGDLESMKSRLGPFQTMVANKAKAVKEDLEYERKRAGAFVDSLHRLDTVMRKILAHMEDIISDEETLDTVDNLHKATYYMQLVDYWNSFLKDSSKTLTGRKSGVPIDSPIITLVGKIEKTIEKITDLADEMYAEGARDVLWAELEPMNKDIKERYEQMIQNLIDKGAPDSKIDKIYKQYWGLNRADHQLMKDLQSRRGSLNSQESTLLTNLERGAAEGLAITPEKIELLLKGQIRDANFFNTYLEGYLYNTDPVIGGLSSFVKNALNDVLVKAQSKFNDFSIDMKDLLEEAGFNPLRIGDFGEKVGFLDTTVTRNKKTGALEERKVWTFLNPFKDYRYEYAVIQDAVEQAQLRYAQTGTKEDKKVLMNAITERSKFMRSYFHQQYTDEYYKNEDLFEKDEIGQIAYSARQEWIDRLRAATEGAHNQSDFLAIEDQLDELWREYRQMHSIYYLDGSLKIDDPENGIYDLSIAKRLTEYKEKSRDFYEWKTRKGAFERAYNEYRQELIDTGFDPDEGKGRALLDEWIKRNTRSAIKPEFFEERERILSEMKALTDKLPTEARNEADKTNIWRRIQDLTGVRDDDNQPDGSKLSPGAIAEIKRLQEQLADIQLEEMSLNGLSRAQNRELNTLYKKEKAGTITQTERNRKADLNALKQRGLTFQEKKTYFGLIQDLKMLSEKQATDYYVDIVNHHLSKIEDTARLKKLLGTTSITTENANLLLKPEIISSLLALSPEFKEWFDNNHIKVLKQGKDDYIEVYERIYAWNIVRPTDEEYMETYDIVNEKGEVVETVFGLPKMKYYYRRVKDEYRNERIVGETVDNQGKWLPKTEEQGAVDDRFVNKEYFDLKNDDPALFRALERLKEHHLKNQEGLNYKSKLYLDYPRFRKSNLEVWQTKGLKGIAGRQINALTIYAKRIKDFLYGAKDDAESGYNYDDQWNLVRADMFDNELTSVPIHGLYDIEPDDVSTDITTTMMKYMLSAERQKQLVEISPVARAIQSVVNNPNNRIKDLDKINKFDKVHRGVITYLNKKGKYIRQEGVNNFIEREFEGQKMKGYTKDVKWINNATNLMFKRASFGFFALNIPSALKNSYGAKFQSMIEASAGTFVNHVSLQQGNVWAYGVMGELSFRGNLYKKGPKSKNIQIWEVFDPTQDRLEDQFGESISRTVAKDLASFTWLYNFRRWVELQATLQIFGGMMYHKKIKQTLPNGEQIDISYMDAWEVRDGKIQLKEGVDPEWGITYDDEGNIKIGKEYRRFKNKVQIKISDLQGAYAKFDQPEAQRYLLFRFLSYLRRYFTTMTLNRFGFSGRIWDPQPRLNPGAGDVRKGYYIEFLQFMKETFSKLGRNLQYMTDEEKAATLKVLTEVGLLVAANAAMGLIFGWDPDDDERYAKLREKSGALPFMFTEGDPDRDFNLPGFLEVHALHLLMNVRAENEQFIPLPGFGLKDYKAFLGLKSIALGPTLNTYFDMFEDLHNMATGDDSAYYQKDSGPYKWQQEGGSKFMAHLARTFGMTGSSLDPAKAIKGFQSVRAMAR